VWEWRRLRSRLARSAGSGSYGGVGGSGGSGGSGRSEPPLPPAPARPLACAPLRLGLRPAASAHPAAAVDYVLAQATALLARARAARDGVEVQRLLQWIDARLDERLRLTGSS
jgi:hypothetical protein